MVTLQLTNFQVDALNEVGNIGIGSATTALSQLVDKRVQISLTHVQLIDSASIIANIPDSITMTGMLVRMMGDIQGAMLFLFEFKNSVVLSDILLKGTKYETDPNMHQSALGEVGNILTGAYLNALQQFLGVAIVPSIPHIATGSITEVMEEASAEAGRDIDNILSIESMFMVHSVEHESGLNTIYGDLW
jgi:chemotaxis protein CheC